MNGPATSWHPTIAHPKRVVDINLKKQERERSGSRTSYLTSTSRPATFALFISLLSQSKDTSPLEMDWGRGCTFCLSDYFTCA